MTTPQLTYNLTTQPATLMAGSTGGFTVHGAVAGEGTADITKVEVYVPLSTDGTESVSLGYLNSNTLTVAPPDGWSGIWNSNTVTFTPNAGTATVGQAILDFGISGIQLNPNPASCQLTVTETATVDWTPTTAQAELPIVVTDGTYVPPSITTSAGKIAPGTSGTINWNGNANYGYLLEPADMFVMPTSGSFDNNENISTVPLLSPYTYTLQVTDTTSTPVATYPYTVTVDVAAPQVTGLTVNGSDSAIVDIDGYVTLNWTTQNADRVTIYMNDVATHTVLEPNGSYTVQIDRPQQFRVSARYGNGNDCDPPQIDNESALFPQDALQVTPTAPKITSFAVANDKLFADSTVYLNWTATNANMIRLENTLGSVLDYTPNVSNYSVGKPTTGVLATGANSPLNYTLWAWYDPSDTRVLVWGTSGASYPDTQPTTTAMAKDAVASDDVEVPEPNDSNSLTLTYCPSEINFKTFTYTGSETDTSLTLPGDATNWHFGVAGFSMQLSGSSSHDLHDIIVNSYSFDGTLTNGDTSGNFSARFYMKDNNGHENSSDAYMKLIAFYTSASATNALLGSGTYQGEFEMTSTSSAKSYETSSAISAGGNPDRVPSEILPFLTKIGVYYPDGDEPLNQLIMDAQSSAVASADSASKVTVSGYSTAFGENTFSTYYPGTGVIGTYGDAGGGYGVVILSEGTADHTFDFEVEDAATVLNKYNGSTSDDQNIYKIQSDRVTCAVDPNNPCKVNLTWGDAYWQDKSHPVTVSRKVVLFARYKVPTAN